MHDKVLHKPLNERMLNFDRTNVFQFIYFYSKELPLCHKLLKHKPRYSLQGNMSWHSDFKSSNEFIISQRKTTQNSRFRK